MSEWTRTQRQQLVQIGRRVDTHRHAQHLHADKLAGGQTDMQASRRTGKLTRAVVQASRRTFTTTGIQASKQAGGDSTLAYSQADG